MADGGSNQKEREEKTPREEKNKERDKKKDKDEEKREKEKEKKTDNPKKTKDNSKKPVFKEKVEISAKAAAEMAEVVAALQQGKNIVVSNRLLKEIKEVLSKSTQNNGDVDGLAYQEVVVWAQKLLQVATLNKAGVEHFNPKEQLSLKVAEALMRSESSELDPETVRNSVKVADLPYDLFTQKEEASGTVYYQRSPQVIVEAEESPDYKKRTDASKLLQEKGVAVELPEKWDKWPPIKRERWRVDNGVFVFKDLGITTVNGISAVKNKDGILTLGGLTPDNINDKSINKLLEAAAPGKTITFPSDVKTPSARIEYLKGQGLRVLPLLKGGSGEDEYDEEGTLKSREEKDQKELEKVTAEDITVEALKKDGIELVFRSTVNKLYELKKAGGEVSSDWDKEMAKLNKVVGIVNSSGNDKKNFDIVDVVDTAARDLENKYKLLGESDVFESLLHRTTIVEISSIRSNLDKHFSDRLQEIITKGNPEMVDQLFKQIDDMASQVIQVQEAGFYGRAPQQRNEYWRTVDQQVLANPQFAEILKWRAIKNEHGFDLNYNEIATRQPSVIWQESEKNLDRILRFVESTDFNEQQLSQAINSAARIVQEIPVNSLRGDERKEAEELQNRLTKRLQSVLAINSFFGQAEHASMNPEEVGKVFASFKDDTYQDFFERFGKDASGHKLETKEVDPDTNEKKVLNLLDVGMNVYMKRLRNERLVMNFIEKWTKDLEGPESGDEDRLKKMLGDDERAKEIIEKQKEAIRFIKTRLGSKDGVDNDFKKDFPSVKKAVTDWYKEKTILGTSDDKVMLSRKREMVGKRSLLEEDPDKKAALEEEENEKRLWEHGFLEELLKNKDKWDLDPKKIKGLLDSGLAEQVMNNAHRLTWLMAWSDYDGIRVWNKEADNPTGKGRVAGYVYNQSTDFFYGRMIDHAWEFYIDEDRGKVGETNLIMQNSLLGERGNLLPQNRTLVRFAADLHPETIEDKVKEKRKGFKNIDRMDMNNEDEKGWAKSAVISEMIDDGELGFEDRQWSKFFTQKEGSWKYKMIDLYGDRTAMMKYMGPDALQKYLQQPNSKKFFEINSLENFYSKREVRLQPWMKLAIASHKETGKYWKKWWGLPDKMTHAEAEEVIEYAAQTNRLDAKYKTFMKNRYLGWGGVPGILPVRFTRQLAEAADISVRESPRGVRNGLFGSTFSTFGEFFKQGFKYIFS